MSEKLMILSVAFLVAAGLMWLWDLAEKREAKREERRRVVRTVLDD